MKMQKKLVATFTSIALVLVLSISTVFIVLASLQGTVKNNFSIYYTAKHVNIGMVGGYGEEKGFYGTILGGGYEHDLTTNSGQQNFLEINKNTSGGSFDSFNIQSETFDDYDSDTQMHNYRASDIYVGFFIFNLGDENLQLTFNTPIYDSTNMNKEMFLFNFDPAYKDDAKLVDEFNNVSGWVDNSTTSLAPSGFTTVDDCMKALELFYWVVAASQESIAFNFYFGYYLFRLYCVLKEVNKVEEELSNKITELTSFAEEHSIDVPQGTFETMQAYLENISDMGDFDFSQLPPNYSASFNFVKVLNLIEDRDYNYKIDYLYNIAEQMNFNFAFVGTKFSVEQDHLDASINQCKMQFDFA